MNIKRIFIFLLFALLAMESFSQLQTFTPTWGSNWNYTFTGLNPNKAYKLKVSGQYRPDNNNNAWERDAAFEFNTNGTNVTPYLLSQNPNSTGNGNCDGRWTLNGQCQPYPTQRLYNTFFPPTYDFWIPLNSSSATVAFWAVNPGNSQGNSFKFDLYERICPIAGFNYTADTIVVKGLPASYTLDAGKGYTTYNWSAGTANIFQATTETYNVTRQFGWYRSLVTDVNGCVGSKSHYVTMLKAKLFQHDTTICSATPITLTADTSGMIGTYAPASLVGYNGPFVNNAGTGSTYFYSTTNNTWTNANLSVSANPIIMQKGGHLATINSLQENTYIRSIVPTTGVQNNAPDYIWFGLYQDTLSPFYAEESGGWINATGEPFNYVNWKTGEPNNQQGGPGAENYAQIWYDSASWNDKYNAFNSPHVIEFEKRNITYLWSTGATTPSITVNPTVTTKYWFSVSDGAAVLTDTITITVLVPVNNAITVNGCNGQTVYNGITYNSSTVLHQTIKNIQGCDSVYLTVNINVTPINPVTNNSTISDCKSIVYKGITYNSSTILRDTVKSVQGCDSIYNIVNINITPIVPKNQDSIFNGCNSITYNGTTYSNSTLLNSTIKSVQGCDSIYKTIHINVTTIVPKNQDSIFSGCNSIKYNGTTYNSSTVLNSTIKSVQGCDSIYKTIHINITPIVSVVQDSIFSGCTSVTYNNITYNSSTILNSTIKSYQGCDSIYKTIHINVSSLVPLVQDSIFDGCNSVSYKGNVYNSSTVLNSTIKSVQGCDSIYKTIHINVTTIVPKNQDSIFSGCNSIKYNGTTYNSSTVLNSTIKSVQGCDSIYKTIHINITPIVSVVQDSIFSGCTSVTYNNITYNSSTILNSTIKSYQGCDSIYKTIHINVSSLVPLVQDSIFDGCNSVSYKGNVYNSSTVLNSTIKSVQGCDSIYKTIHINVTTIVPKNQDSIFSGCNSIKYNGTTYNSSTILNSTIKSIQGCDSIYKTIHINVTPIVALTNVSTLTGCNSILYNGVTYTSSTVLNSTIKSVQGCDSIYNVVNINVTPIVPVTKTSTFSGCNSVVYNGNTYTSSTVLNSTVKSVQGCDSIYNVVNINVTPIVPVTKTSTFSGCNSVVYNGNTYTSSTVLNNTVKSVQGCDSIYNVININVTPIVPVTKNITVSGCNSVVYNGITYNNSTVLNSTIKSVQGCDSVYNVVNINITAIVPVTKNTTVSGCNSVVYNGITYTSSTVLNSTIKSVQGCDSIYNVANIVVTPIVPVTKNVSVNGCNSVVYNGITYTSSTSLNTTIKSVQGCDSVYNVVNINLTPIVPVTKTVTINGCNSVVYNGITYTSSAVFNNTIVSSQGCDSIYQIINVVVHPKPVVSVSIPAVVCLGTAVTASYQGSINNIASAIWSMGNGYTQSAISLNYTYTKFGFYNVSVVFTDTNGCVTDPVKKIVDVLPGPYLSNLYDTTILSGSSFQINGQTNEALSSILWQPPIYLSSDTILDPVCSPLATTNYTVKIVDTFGCATLGSIKVKVVNIPQIPNVFSPNGDGDHDKWVFGNLTSDNIIEVKVFDRNGQIVYTNYNYDNLWDGTRGGQPLPMGTYYYIINVNKLYSISGWVLIIR